MAHYSVIFYTFCEMMKMRLSPNCACSAGCWNVLLYQGFLLLQLDRRGNQAASGAPVFAPSADSRLGCSPRQLNAAAVLRRSSCPLHLTAPIRQWQLLPGDGCGGWVRHRPWSWLYGQCGVDWCNDGWCRVPRCVPVLADFSCRVWSPF